MDERRHLGCILGSSYDISYIERWGLTAQQVETDFGSVTLHAFDSRKDGRRVFLLFRHGVTHTLLPHQIPYRAHMQALARVGCQSVLVTSSVGVLDHQVPLNTLLWVEDILMPDNRLPDGSACSIFPAPTPGQGHLVLEDGLCHRDLTARMRLCIAQQGVSMHRDGVVFAYVGGPRTKTRAENRYWANMGAQVNSMTLAPEIVLANELEMSCCALVVGHKYSSGARLPVEKGPTGEDAVTLDIQGQDEVTQSLERSRATTDHVLHTLLCELVPAPFANHIYRFD